MAEPTVAATARLASASEPTGGAPTADGRNRTSSSFGVNAGLLARPRTGRTTAGRALRPPPVLAASGRTVRVRSAGAAGWGGGGGENTGAVAASRSVCLGGELFRAPPPA